MPPTNRTVARPNIELRAENAQLQRDVNKLTKMLERQLARGARRGGRRFDQALRSAITRPLAGLVATVGAAFTGVALARGVRSFANTISQATTSIDDLTKASERLGVGSDGLQTLGLVAEEAGASFEQLEQGIARFTVNLGDAVNGVGAAVGAFETLGLDAQALAAQSLVEQLSAVDTALTNLPSVQAAALRDDIFGEGGRQLANILGTGRLRIQTEEAGGFLDRIGARITQADRASTAAFLDAGNRLRVAFEALAASVAVQLTPSLTNLAKALTDQVAEITKGIQTGDVDIANDLQRIVDNFAETLGRLQLEFARTGGTLRAVNRAWERTADAFGVGVTALDWASLLLPYGLGARAGLSAYRGFRNVQTLRDTGAFVGKQASRATTALRDDAAKGLAKNVLGTLSFSALGIGAAQVQDDLRGLVQAIRELGQSAEAIEAELEARYAQINSELRKRARDVQNEEPPAVLRSRDKRLNEYFMGDDGVNALRSRLRAAREYETQLKALQTQIETRQALAEPFVGPIKDYAGSFPQLPTTDIGDANLFEDLLGGLASARAESEAFVSEFETGINRIKDSLTDSRAFTEPFADARRELEDLREATLELDINPQRGEQLVKIDTQLKRLDVANVRELKYELEGVAESLIPTNAQFKELSAQLEQIKNSKFGPQLQNEIEAIESRMSVISTGIADVWQASVNRMGSAIDSMIDGASLSFRDFTAALLRDWAKVIARVTLFGQDGTSGILGSVFGSLIGGLGGLFKAAPVAEVGPGFDFQSFARGGPMKANIPTLVGEEGPELIYPQRSGFVANNEQLQQLAKRSREALTSVVEFNGGDNYDQSNRVETAISQAIRNGTASEPTRVVNNNVTNQIQAGVNQQELAFAMEKTRQQVLADLIDVSGGRAEFAVAMSGGNR